jgi:hypothetical protein
MAQFPADWEVFPDSEYNSFHRMPMEDTGTGVNVLVPFSAAGRSSGAFKIHLFGAEGLTAKFPLSKIVHNLPSLLSDLTAEAHYMLEDVIPPPNTTTTPWDDAEDLYKKRALLLFYPNGEPASEADLLTFFRIQTSDKSCRGASLRWAVAAVNASEVILELQSLPTNARYLTKPNLKADNTVSVLVSTFKLNADLFDGESISGPVPLIFTPDREATLAAFAANPDTLHADMSAVNERFLQMEHLTLDEAVAYLQKGKARRGGGIPAFATSGGYAPPSKRARPQSAIALDTGKFTAKIIFHTYRMRYYQYRHISHSMYINLHIEILPRSGK